MSVVMEDPECEAKSMYTSSSVSTELSELSYGNLPIVTNLSEYNGSNSTSTVHCNQSIQNPNLVEVLTSVAVLIQLQILQDILSINKDNIFPEFHYEESDNIFDYGEPDNHDMDNGAPRFTAIDETDVDNLCEFVSAGLVPKLDQITR